MPEITYITRAGDLIDEVAAKVYGKQVEGQLEAVLERNVNISRQPIILPAGVTIVFPDLSTKAVDTVRLW